jgi:hypothetical protein
MNQYLQGGIAVIAIFMLVARPVTVFACTLPDRWARWSFNEMLFMCWTRETGVIPAALAGILLGMKAPGGADDRFRDLYCHDDDPHSGPDHPMAGRQAGAPGRQDKGLIARVAAEPAT